MRSNNSSGNSWGMHLKSPSSKLEFLSLSVNSVSNPVSPVKASRPRSHRKSSANYSSSGDYSYSSSSGGKYPDDSDGPNEEPCEVIQYNGPRYPDDSDGPNAIVYKRGHSIWSDHGWISDGQPYSGPKYPDD